MSTIIETKRSAESAKSIILSAFVPERTDSYAPVPHKDVIDITMEHLDKSGLKLIGENYSVARDGNQAMGFYNIATDDKEMNIRLIWHNSYDKTMPLRWAMGGNVIVCTNGMVRGDMGAFKRKHTGTILSEYSEQVGDSMQQAGDYFRKIVADREKMKQIELTKRECSELIGRMFIEEALLSATQIGIIKNEIENPSYQYNAENSLWELYNHCTVSFKEAHPTLHTKYHTKLHEFITTEFELVS